MANEYQNTQGTPAIVGLGTCGVEYGPLYDLKKCSLPAGHPEVRNFYGHYRDPSLDKTVAENQLPPNTLESNEHHVVRDAMLEEKKIDCCGDRYPCYVDLVCSCGVVSCRGCMTRHLLHLHSGSTTEHTMLPRPLNHAPYEAMRRSTNPDVWVVVAPWNSCVAIYGDEEAQGHAEMSANFCNQAYQRGHSAGLAQGLSPIKSASPSRRSFESDGGDR